MALDKQGYAGRITANLKAAGFKVEGEHAWVDKLAKAVADATVDEFQSNAKADVLGGSSKGQHPIT